MLYLAVLQEQVCDGSDRSAAHPEYEIVVRNLKAEFHDVMPENLPNRLPPERFVDHTIDLEAGAVPPARVMYRHSFAETKELQRQLTELLEQGFIQPSKSPYGAPVLFVKKKGGAMRMCIDYRALNKITVKNRCPLPRIDDLLERLQGAKFFTSLDLRSGYHQIRISPADVHKTAFRTRFGHFEFKVLSFGLCNAPATFQTLMNHIFHDYLDAFVLVYLDDIMIFSSTAEDHQRHVRLVLRRLRKHELYVNGPKCHYFMSRVHWLGHVISAEGIEVDFAKIAVVRDWPAPTTP